MVKILRSIFAFIFVAECDLIGYNRLGNNVGHHARYRSDRTIDTTQYQILQWMFSDKTRSTAEKQKWIQKLRHNNGSNKQKRTNFLNNRRNVYRRTMLSRKNTKKV